MRRLGGNRRALVLFERLAKAVLMFYFGRSYSGRFSNIGGVMVGSSFPLLRCYSVQSEWKEIPTVIRTKAFLHCIDSEISKSCRSFNFSDPSETSVQPLDELLDRRFGLMVGGAHFSSALTSLHFARLRRFGVARLFCYGYSKSQTTFVYKSAI